MNSTYAFLKTAVQIGGLQIALLGVLSGAEDASGTALILNGIDVSSKKADNIQPELSEPLKALAVGTNSEADEPLAATGCSLADSGASSCSLGDFYNGSTSEVPAMPT